MVDETWEPYDNTVIENVGNIISENNNGMLQINQTLEIKVPKNDVNDFTIAIRASSIRKVRKACKNAKKGLLNWSEVLLGLSTLFGGGFFSAIISKLDYEFSYLNVFFYTLCPMVAVGFFVAYLFCRNKASIDAVKLAELIEEYIEDPDEGEREVN